MSVQEEFKDLWHALMDDLAAAERALREKKGGQFERRNFSRILFSVVDGYIFSIKRQVLEREKVTPGSYSVGEIALLRDETYTIDSKGNVKSSSKFLRTEDNLKFAMNLHLRAVHPTFRLDLGSQGWEAFKRALLIRHRITHPKDAKDLVVSERELDDSINAMRWFLSTITLSLISAVQNATELLKTLEDAKIPNLIINVSDGEQK